MNSPLSNHVARIFQDLEPLLGSLEGVSMRQKQRWYNQGNSPAPYTTDKVVSWIWDKTHKKGTNQPDPRWKNVLNAIKKVEHDAPCRNWTKETMVAWFINLAKSSRPARANSSISPTTSLPGAAEGNSPEVLRSAKKAYLDYLFDRHRYLPFKGLGIADRVPLKLELLDLYVPLKAHIEIPRGETWARDLRVAGRDVPETERASLGERLSEPVPVLDLLEKHAGLIILGDPGAGKTTFLKYITLLHAMDKQRNKRLPVLVPLSAYANTLANGNVRLDDFVAGYYHDIGSDLPIDGLVREAFREGTALVMLDGLDEVTNLSLRYTVVERVAEFFLNHRAGNKFLITSRIVGYREVRPTVTDLEECTLADFDDGEIEEFVTRWTIALEKGASGDTAPARQDAEGERLGLLEAVQRNPGVRRLAANPLLLTILALMKRQGVELPRRRVELYQKYVETMLSSWNRARGLGRPPARDLDVVETVKVLAPLALWMHRVNPGVGMVKRHDLEQKLQRLFAKRALDDVDADDVDGDLLNEIESLLRERGEANPKQAARDLLNDTQQQVRGFLCDVHQHTNLLIERGPDQYGFIHLTFEEYLAAIAQVQLGQQDIVPVVAALLQNLGKPDWQEVTLLTVGYLGIVQQRDEAAASVIKKLLDAENSTKGLSVAIAGEIVCDVWPGGVTAACCKLTVTRLQEVMVAQNRVEARNRARAGAALGRLGDPRPGVGVKDGLPDIEWISIPAGKFKMGGREERQEGREFLCGLIKQPYKISRFPITVAQYQAFVEDKGYEQERFWNWSAAASQWRQSLKTPGPENYGPDFQVPNHPRVGVSWFEAVAFCRWLGEKLKRDIRLPSEAEWERAARGIRGRAYPWGDKTNLAQRCNMDKTGIGHTSAVGLFPSGDTPCEPENKKGVADLAGNVWEWCRTKWVKDYRNYEQKVNDELEDLDYRVLRGGSFFLGRDVLRCAFRNLNVPGYRGFNFGFRVVLVAGESSS